VLRSSRSRRVLFATGLVGASALVGITLGQANEPDRGPSSITRAGLTIQLPPGWQEGDLDPGRPALSSPIAATAPGETTAGLVVGKLSSVAAAGRALGQAEAGDGTGAGTRVRLGEVDAWRYRGLSPRPGLTGTGYVVPTAGGAVLMLCHASNATPPVRLTECERAASTLVVRGEQPPVDLWRTRLDEVIAELRSRRSEGRRGLARAERAAGQAGAASALARSYQRAARSVESISLPEPAASLASLSAALREVADSYEHLARAARARRGTAYRDARDAVARSEAEVQVELARAGRS
jgi:hypothetical protein